MAYTTIDKPTDYFNTKLYTGTGSAQSITGVGFQPDWIWIKQRSGTTHHKTSDAVRGATKALKPNNSDEEGTDGQGITSFDSDGFSLGTGGDYNGSSNTQVAWNWLAGGSASSNSNGSITSSVSANTTAGFSIVSYTGTGSNATVGHGLGVAPKMIFFKNRSGANNWNTYQESLGAGQRMRLNTTGASESSTGFMNNTSPTSSVFTVGTSSDTNISTNNYIAYCFAEKKGYSKFGKYTGNESTDGTFVYTGFKPAFVMAKPSSQTGSWSITDNKRLGYNGDNKRLYPNLTLAEESQAYDLFSNGFKATTTSGNNNASGQTYIYMAFAEAPFVTSTGIPTTAR